MRSKLTWILTPLLVLLSLSFSFAQERAVSGNVVDQDNVPLPGVSVVVVGTTRGTQTDFDGNYTIRANSNETLRFTYIGQTTVDRPVGTSSVINVQMQEDAETLEEVVVTGYRTTTKEKSSIASQTITSKTIENRPNANVNSSQLRRKALFPQNPLFLSTRRR